MILHPEDNVATCLNSGGPVPPGHKYAIHPISRGEDVVKYGAVIGRATQNIKEGEWVHEHNLVSRLAEDVSYTYEPHLVDPKRAVAEPGKGKDFFLGYPRKQGPAGIRNDLYIIPTVGCVNHVCQRLEAKAQCLVKGGLEGIYALTHPFGCSQLGEDLTSLQDLLCAIAQNPNAAGVLFVGLGCENNRLEEIQARLAGRENISYLCCQEVEDELEEGFLLLEELAIRIQPDTRTAIPLSQLCLGLKCGGSDGFSGITANPLVGKISDLLVAAGGSAVLTEVPEMFGAEQRLMNKCQNSQVFAAYRDLILSYRDYYQSHGVPPYENPSPGNRAGGITTLEEKSLGCVEKAGQTPIVDVLSYGERVCQKGISVLSAPGNDLIAATALGASGCQMVLFTTGRGTPFSTFVPTLKISTNRDLARKKPHWIDFDGSSPDVEGLWERILDTASGHSLCKSEDRREIAFFKRGVTL